MLGEDPIPFERGVREENVYRVLTEQEMEEAEVNAADLKVVSYMEAPAAELKNESMWEGIALANPWTAYKVMSQQTGDRSIYISYVFGSKEDVIHAAKMFSVRSHQKLCLKVHQNVMEAEVQVGNLVCMEFTYCKTESRRSVGD